MDRKPMQMVGSTKKQLRCKLDDAELIEFGERLASVSYDKASTEENFNAVKAEWKSKLASLDAEGARLAGIVRSKFEVRDVEVSLIRDYSTGEYQEVRTDTEEVILKRPLETHERQMDLAAVNEAEGSISLDVNAPAPDLDSDDDDEAS